MLGHAIALGIQQWAENLWSILNEGDSSGQSKFHKHLTVQICHLTIRGRGSASGYIAKKKYNQRRKFI